MVTTSMRPAARKPYCEYMLSTCAFTWAVLVLAVACR
jgi:hypothetical protein